MPHAAVNILWAVVFAALGAALGVAFMLGASVFIPRIIARLTPNLDEEREIARGNTAVAEYFGRVVASAVLGIGIIVAAAILGGLVVALY